MKKKISPFTASSIVVANMIGTGVFTSVGFQLNAVQNSWSILLLWILGGILSLIGAFAYAELGTRFPQSGGDYIFLSRVFHPLLGFLSAWAGLIVGFSAPVSLAAIAFIKYLSPFGLQNSSWLAIAAIIGIGLVHSFTLTHSSRFQNFSTIIKIAFIAVLIGLGLLLDYDGENAISFTESWKQEILTPGFAVSMVYVAFAYTGWNSAAYVSEEIENPVKNLPKILIGSTLFVSVLYVLFQLALLRNGSVADLAGKEEVTFVSFQNLLGESGAKWVSIFIAIQLLATISSYLWVGPRVTWAMAKEHSLWKALAKTNGHGIPVAAVWAHVAISIVLMVTGTFEKIILYAGFVLQLMSSLTVATSLFINRKEQSTYITPFKPWLQVIFLLFNLWVLVFTLINRPVESLAGLGILAIGVVVYFFKRR